MKTFVFVTLCLVVAMGVVAASGLGASAETRRAPSAPPTEKTGDDAVGASIVHPEELVVDRERHTYDGTYGFTLWEPEEEGPSHDHGGEPAVRVAIAYDLKPGQIEGRVRERIAAYPNLEMKRETVLVGEKRLKGVAVGPIPGSTPSTEVYVAAMGRVYQINVYFGEAGQEGLDDGDRRLLSGLRFYPPSRSVDSLKLKDGKKAESYYGKGNSEPSDKELEERKKAAAEASTEAPAEETPPGPAFQTVGLSTGDSLERGPSTVYTAASTGEYGMGDGCWSADSAFYFQTQHGYGANRLADDNHPTRNIPTGYTVVGDPNYWGEYTHGDYGYGRCASTYYTNDKYAVDYPLNRGDYVFSPFQKGTVTFAGRNTSHANYGIFVVIKASNGKYVSMSAHLNSLAYGIRPGKVVYADTVIGYAGNTGDPSIPVGHPHLHQAYYRYPSFKADGSPYGGRGLRALHHHYTGTGRGVRPGVYKFATPVSDTSSTRTRGELVGN